MISNRRYSLHTIASHYVKHASRACATTVASRRWFPILTTVRHANGLELVNQSQSCNRFSLSNSTALELKIQWPCTPYSQYLPSSHGTQSIICALVHAHVQYDCLRNLCDESSRPDDLSATARPRIFQFAYHIVVVIYAPNPDMTMRIIYTVRRVTHYTLTL
jgi:hypothetical protein